MYQGKSIHTVRNVQSAATPLIPPLYHWLGADAECLTQEAMAESTAIPFYHWLGADAEKVASQAAE
jgi:hypothetical protein